MASRLADRVRALDIQMKAYRILWRQTRCTVQRKLADRAYVLQIMRGLHKNITALKAGERDLDIVWRAVHETRLAMVARPASKNVLETLEADTSFLGGLVRVALILVVLCATILVGNLVAPAFLAAFCAIGWAVWSLLAWAESVWRAQR